MALVRLEKLESGRPVFVEICVTDRQVEIIEGVDHPDRPPARTVRTCSTPQLAEKVAAMTIQAKQAAGYQRFEFGAMTAFDAELERAIRAELGNERERDVCMVYGDWLLEHDNPLGQLIQRSCAATDRTSRSLPAQFAEDRVLWAPKLFRAALGEPLWENFRTGWTLRHGLARTIYLIDRVVDACRDLFARPICRLVEDLTIDTRSREDPRSSATDQPVVERAIAALDPGDAPGLVQLRLRSGPLTRLDLATLASNHPTIRTLQIDCPSPGLAARAVSRTSWPDLRKLELRADGQPLAGALDPRALPRLEECALGEGEISRELVEAFATGPLIRQLARVSFHDCGMTDELATVLLRHDAFTTRQLDLSGNHLSSRMLSKLQRRIPQLHGADAQRPEASEHYDEIME